MYDESHIGNVVYSTEYECPNCGSNETDYDGFCIHCGEFVVQYEDLELAPYNMQTDKNHINNKTDKKTKPSGKSSKKDRITILSTIILFCFAMVILIGSLSSTKKRSERIAERVVSKNNAESVVSDKTEMVGDFEYAEFERFNSPAEENGLGDSRIYFEGTLVEGLDEISDIVYCIIEQEDGNKWGLTIGMRPFNDGSKLPGIIGKKVKVFGIYGGFSEKLKMPMVDIHESDCRIEVIDGTLPLRYQDFISSKDSIINWYYEAGITDTLYNDRMDLIDESKWRSSFKCSAGILDNLYRYTSALTLTQATSDGFQSQYIAIKNTLDEMKEDELISIEDLEEGDFVRIYYYVDGKDTQCLAIEKADPLFTAEDIKQEFIGSCSEYSYKEIARNTERVKGQSAKLTGKVIQTLIDGNSYNLRVNITPQGHGYYSDTIFVTYTKRSTDEDKILEDDIITIYGTLAGEETYTAVFGQSVTLPRVNAEYIDIQGE